jgi:S1-C subfamily serine protease/predicted esterase
LVFTEDFSMVWRSSHLRMTLLAWLGIALLPAAAQTPAAEDLDALHEQAIKAAVLKVAPSIVQIETSGGTDILSAGPRAPVIRKGTGPTTGLIVAPDGYVITSAFNFANKPSAIFVAVPGQKERFVAKVVATDQTRMLTLLKIDAGNLPVPAAVPKREIKVGQTALALGRTWSTPDAFPSVSVGIISALGRIWGKAIQTDAKVSPVNYGGPLVDLRGRVQGVLVPASPRAEGETAGVEWYDSGIGFAIPLEDVGAVLPRLKAGKDLKKGLLGIELKDSDLYGARPEVANVVFDSVAAQAGVKAGDLVLQIDGRPVVSESQIRHLLGPKYEGDIVSLKLKRGEEEIDLPNLKLAGTLTAFVHPFLGVLPMRDDPELGQEVRYVFPKSPADVAGLKAGDRILKLTRGEGPARPFSGRDQLTELLNPLRPGTELNLEVARKEGGKTETLKVTLGLLPETVPADLPQPATHKKALEPRKSAGPVMPPAPRQKGERKPEGTKQEDKKPEAEMEQGKKEDKEEKKPETGLLQRANATKDQEYWLYVPEDYDPNIAHALVIWLHPAGRGKDRDAEALAEAWQELCSEYHLILMGPKAENETGWLASEADIVAQLARDVMNEYTIDRQRVVAHGMGVGGQLAFYLGLNSRDLIRGVATVGAVLANQPKDNVASQRLAFFLVAGGKDPLLPAITESSTKLAGHKFPVVYREVADRGHQYLDPDTLLELARWIDSLDRQ